MYACMTVVSGLPMGRCHLMVTPQSGAHARVARLRQRLGGDSSRKRYGGGVSRRCSILQNTISGDLYLHAHSARRTSMNSAASHLTKIWSMMPPVLGDHCGILYKRGHMNTKFKMRFFVLRGVRI